MNGATPDIIAQIRQKTPCEVFDYQTLMGVLSDYRKPRDVIIRLTKHKVIIRLKKGLYCFGETFRRQPVSREHLANLIYGPSYVSLDYALSFHGMIPERVETVTSVTTLRSKRFDTPLGVYSYRMLLENRYTCGAVLESSGKVSFLMATPEKALVDKIWCDKRFRSLCVSDYEAYLIEDLRIAAERLCLLDRARLASVAEAYNSAKLNKFMKFMKQFGDTYHA